MFPYQNALAIALIVAGFALVFLALIWRHQGQTEPAESDDGSELRAFVDALPPIDDTLPPIDEEVDARPRIDRIRKKDSRGRTDETLRPRIDRRRNEESFN